MDVAPIRSVARGAVSLLLASLLVACSSDADRPAGWRGPGSGLAGGTAFDGESAAGGARPIPCDEGAELRCWIVYDQASGVRSCWEGVRICRDGRWGACVPTSPHPDLPDLD